MSGRWTRVAVAFVVWFVVVQSTSADVLRVPEDYSTVIAAVDAAASGDTVLVGDGVWTDVDTRAVLVCGNLFTTTSVAFPKPGLTIISMNGPAHTTLDAGPDGEVTLVFGEDTAADPIHVRGFTITGGNAGAFVGCASDVFFSDCLFVDCGEQAIVMRETAVSVDGCEFIRNQGFGSSTGAIFANSGSDLSVSGSRFESNPRGAISANDPEKILIEGCEFVDHTVRRPITVSQANNVIIRDSLFLRNRTTGSNLAGGAIGIHGGSIATIEFNTFAYDSVLAAHGGALSVLSSFAAVRRNTFYRCYTPGGGAAVYLAGAASANCQNNIAVECGGYAFSASSATVLPQSGCNVLWGNTDDYGTWPDEARLADIHVDPEFCDPEFLDFRVSSSSIALPENSPVCGAAGPFGVGCGTTGIEPTSWGRLKSLYRE